MHDLSFIFSDRGPLKREVPHFLSRPEQLEMCSEVAASLKTGEHLAVEAGTGVGKSLAYLIPAALWAVDNNKQVIGGRRHGRA